MIEPIDKPNPNPNGGILIKKTEMSPKPIDDKIVFKNLDKDKFEKQK